MEQKAWVVLAGRVLAKELRHFSCESTAKLELPAGVKMQVVRLRQIRGLRERDVILLFGQITLSLLNGCAMSVVKSLLLKAVDSGSDLPDDNRKGRPADQITYCLDKLAKTLVIRPRHELEHRVSLALHPKEPSYPGLVGFLCELLIRVYQPRVEWPPISVLVAARNPVRVPVVVEVRSSACNLTENNSLVGKGLCRPFGYPHFRAKCFLPEHVAKTTVLKQLYLRTVSANVFR